MHRRWRGEAHRLSDLAHRRRVAVLVDVLREEVPDLLLSAGQHRATSRSLAGTNIRSPHTVAILPDGVKQPARAGRPRARAARSGSTRRGSAASPACRARTRPPGTPRGSPPG